MRGYNPYAVRFSALALFIVPLLNKGEEVGQDFIGKQCLIPYQPLETSVVESIPNPPELLINWLGGCTKEEQEGY